MRNRTSLACPVATMVLRRLPDGTVRFGCRQYDSATKLQLAFPVASPCGRRHFGEFPERPPEMYRIGKTGSFGHLVE